MKSHALTWKLLSLISFVCSFSMICLGADKMLNYDSGEFYPYEYHNAYVGGDAYNYIINGNYATGFFVLATMFAVFCVGFMIVMYLEQININRLKENDFCEAK